MLNKKLLFLLFIISAVRIDAQTMDTLKYYYPYYPDSSNTFLFIGNCLDPGWCEPIAVWFTPDSTLPDTSYHSYSIKEIRFCFSNTQDTAFSIHFGNQVPIDNNRVYRKVITLTSENINSNFFVDVNYLFTSFDMSQVDVLQNISIDKSFWVLVEGKVATVYNTAKPGTPPQTSGHSYQGGLPLGWDRSGCDWIIEAVVEYHKEKVDNLTDPKDKTLPKQAHLQQNYPNPFNTTTVIKYYTPKTTNVELRVFDILGKEVFHKTKNKQQAGNHTITLNASRWGSGIYFYQVKTNTFSQTKKMLLIE